MKRKYDMKYFHCPYCGKQLINLSHAEDEEDISEDDLPVIISTNLFWCDDCHLDFEIKISTESL